MLKEKDKRIVLLVIFGVALVSLVTALIACFVNGLTVVCDIDRLVQHVHSFYYIVSAVLLALGVLSLVYVCIKLFVRKTSIPSLVLACAVVCYVIASTLALRYSVPTYGSGYFMSEDYSLFQTTYVAVAVTLAISAAIVETSHLLIVRMDRKQAKENETQAEDKPQAEIAEQ